MFDYGAPTQKPAAQFCGRVLGGAIDLEQNTMFDRTSQTKFEVFFHRCGKDRRAVRVGFAGLWAQIEIRERGLIFVRQPSGFPISLAPPRRGCAKRRIHDAQLRIEE
jgi:hypothetical protein